MSIIFLKIAIKSILKNRLNSTIGIVGFSIGVAACLFIFLFIKFETGFDNFHTNSERLYRITGTYHTTKREFTSGTVWYPTAPDIKNEIPGIDDFCRIYQFGSINFSSNGKIHKVKELSFVDENFFRFLNFELLTGNPETIFNNADKIVLTEKKEWVAIAFIIACPVAYYVMNKWLENFAYKTELSWWIFALAGLIALIIALLTVSTQSWRAATRNPVENLKYE